MTEGESTALTLKLERSATAAAPAPAADANLTSNIMTNVPEGAPPSRQKMYGWIGLGVGGAGIVIGGITGLVAMSRHGSLESDCPNGKCSPAGGQDTIDGFRSMATVSTVSFVVGGIAAAAGGALLLTAPGPAQTGQVRPYVGLGSVGANVTF